jgi:hypothetical protein
MSKFHISPKAIYGWKPDVVDNGILIDDKNILFVAGKLLVLFNYKEKTQKISNLAYSGFATCLSLSPSKKLVGVGQYTPNQKATVEIFGIPFGRKHIVSAGTLTSNVYY